MIPTMSTTSFAGEWNVPPEWATLGFIISYCVLIVNILRFYAPLYASSKNPQYVLIYISTYWGFYRTSWPINQRLIRALIINSSNFEEGLWVVTYGALVVCFFARINVAAVAAFPFQLVLTFEHFSIFKVLF